MLRHSVGHCPQLTFTSDFHELVQGDLLPGPCRLRYDPLRLLGEDNRNAQHEIHAHIRFHPGGGEWQDDLIVPANARLKDLADPAGQGLMLETTFTLPSHCKELEAWFSCTHADGHTHWDSNFGKNYWLRFPLHDLEIKTAQIRSPTKKAAEDAFVLEVLSVNSVDAIDVRWRLPNVPDEPRRSASLSASAGAGGKKSWRPALPIQVPHQGTVVFDLVYSVEGRKFTDDNQGRWYLAD